MSNVSLPTDIAYDILVRLSPEHLVRFRSVCKSWKEIIDDASFAESNLLRQKDDFNLVMFVSNSRSSALISLNSLYCHPGCETKTIELKTAYNKEFNLPLVYCNGLVAGYIGSNYTLWNLLTGECHSIPSFRILPGIYGPESQTGSYGRGTYAPVGFGYDVVTDDYKVVRVFTYYNSYIIDTLLYSLKSDKWRRIDNYPKNTYWTPTPDHGVFVNGAIHWVAVESRLGAITMRGIIALDLSTEKYHPISLPPISERLLQQGNYPTTYHYHLSVLNEYLVFSNSYEAWILNNYGGKQHWTKLLSLKHCFRNETRLLAYIKSKELVLIQNGDEGFLWYHVQTGRMKKVTIKGLDPCFTSQVIPTSLIRLRGSYLKETLFGSRDRLKLELTTSDV